MDIGNITLYNILIFVQKVVQLENHCTFSQKPKTLEEQKILLAIPNL